MKLDGIWHPKYGWIENTSESFCRGELPVEVKEEIEVYDDG